MSDGRFQLARGQWIELSRLKGEDILRIDSGCLVLETKPDAGRGIVAILLLPGDVFSLAAAPKIASLGLTAARDVLATWISAQTNSDQRADHGVDRASLDRLVAASILDAVRLRNLTAEERLATLLIELALRLGRPTPGGCTFEMPMERALMAHYLHLNPDTLSRLMSRLRAGGIISATSRGWMTVRNMEALGQKSPLAGALYAGWPGGGCNPQSPTS